VLDLISALPFLLGSPIAPPYKIYSQRRRSFKKVAGLVWAAHHSSGIRLVLSVFPKV